MYNQQNYRGNVQGNFQNAQPFASSFGGSQVSSQYRGMQNSFQPTGTVQSFYGQQNQSGSYGGMQNANSFHASNYRGNQQGHDTYLRADAMNPSNRSSFGVSSWSSSNSGQQWGSGTSASINPSYSSYGGQSMNAGQFHTSGYRGNQPGHDSYLRADSANPSSAAGVSSMGSFGMSTGMSNGSFGTSSFSAQAPVSSYGYQPQMMNTNSFHTSGYRGDQPGHDQNLRADSVQPGSQFQSQMGAGFSNFR